jgi:hypothetical protein
MSVFTSTKKRNNKNKQETSKINVARISIARHRIYEVCTKELHESWPICGGEGKQRFRKKGKKKYSKKAKQPPICESQFADGAILKPF